MRWEEVPKIIKRGFSTPVFPVVVIMYYYYYSFKEKIAAFLRTFLSSVPFRFWKNQVPDPSLPLSTYSYAAVLVVFLGNFNPSTLTG